ncbi:MAG: phosphate ABC transporter substrate-binding protein PstS [Neisseria sp.]|nr:phosphate ABC transporter substrate-binding protein PstS [Neisseria sp.]
MRIKLLALLVSSAVVLAACSGGNQSTGNANETASTAAPAQTTPNAQTVTGAGASFPQPIYAQWAQAYQQSTGNQINYQSIGSSGGIKQIIAKTVDFGATDAPLSKENLDKDGLIQFPTVVGGVVPVVNVDGVAPGQLKLSGTVLADIYLGKIKKWNDPAITALNEGVSLPDAAITTVFRSDGSGTSFNFTNYLSQVSPEWEKTVGAANSVKWPTATDGTGAAGKGNEGVSATVGKVKNSIGYVEYAYAKQNNMSHTALMNKAGNVVQPSQESFAAAADTDWQSAPGYQLVLTNQGSDQAWPIASATFIVVHTKPDNPERVKAALAFFDWAYKNGDEAAAKLDYVPLTDNTKQLMRDSWKQVVGADGQPVYTSAQ